MGIDQLMLMLVDFMDNIKSSVISLINQMSISLDYLLCSLIVIIIFFLNNFSTRFASGY